MSFVSLSARHAALADRRLRMAAAVLIGSAVLAVSAHVSVPFWPVPITLQTLAVFALGAVLGPIAGAAAVLAYALEGLIGLPVFAQGVGLATLLGPTGGYILGFAFAAALVGYSARRGWLAHPVRAAAAFLLADVILFAFGVAWLATLVGWQRAVAGGVAPFLLGEVLKIGLATAACRLLVSSARR